MFQFAHVHKLWFKKIHLNIRFLYYIAYAEVLYMQNATMFLPSESKKVNANWSTVYILQLYI